MKISLITPAKKYSKSGNRTTALRWAKILRTGGHRVRVEVDYNGEDTDLMIAIHAWHSAPAIKRYRARFSDGPLVVGLGGTDINTFLKTQPKTTLRSMEMADVLICLHDLIGKELPLALRGKLHVIRQSAMPLASPRHPAQKNFDICVIGHLRDEKDPFRTALAARLLPPSSRIRVIHLGKATTPDFHTQANAEMTNNPRYHWQGEVPGWRVRRELSKTRLMVISSTQEGGANVISEAIVADVPIIASDIAGNVGLLGDDYPGYYPVGDEAQLAHLLDRAETDAAFLETLTRHGQMLKAKFEPAHEQKALLRIINSIARPA
ncbi:MAG: TIGR04348 family glycosyltransferase [Rhodospirillaceae bacterium]|nr:MAG: TIGR04348 family glycosyltransferase [Rhodospirillaceae bacterium]